MVLHLIVFPWLPALITYLSLSSRKMSSVDFLAQEKIWFDKPRYDDAERRFHEQMNKSSQSTQVTFILILTTYLCKCCVRIKE